MTDWVNKIGPNDAQLWTNHEEGEASDRYVDGEMTSDDGAYIQIRFLGRDYRAGTLPGTGIEPWYGLGWNKIASNGRFQLQIITKPSRIDQQLDYTRNNLARNTYVHNNSSQVVTLTDNYCVLQDNEFISHRMTRV